MAGRWRGFLTCLQTRGGPGAGQRGLSVRCHTHSPGRGASAEGGGGSGPRLCLRGPSCAPPGDPRRPLPPASRPWLGASSFLHSPCRPSLLGCPGRGGKGRAQSPDAALVGVADPGPAAVITAGARVAGRRWGGRGIERRAPRAGPSGSGGNYEASYQARLSTTPRPNPTFIPLRLTLKNSRAVGFACILGVPAGGCGEGTPTVRP